MGSIKIALQELFIDLNNILLAINEFTQMKLATFRANKILKKEEKSNEKLIKFISDNAITNIIVLNRSRNRLYKEKIESDRYGFLKLPEIFKLHISIYKLIIQGKGISGSEVRTINFQIKHFKLLLDDCYNNPIEEYYNPFIPIDKQKVKSSHQKFDYYLKRGLTSKKMIELTDQAKLSENGIWIEGLVKLGHFIKFLEENQLFKFDEKGNKTGTARLFYDLYHLDNALKSCADNIKEGTIEEQENFSNLFKKFPKPSMEDLIDV